MRRVAVLLVGGIVAASLTPRASAGYAPTRLFCTGQLAFSPDLRREKTGFCMYADPIVGVMLYVTHDAGESWEHARAEGLVSPSSAFGTHMFLSPRFTSDRALYVQTDGGLFVSTDHGKTFELLEERAPGTGIWIRDIEPYVEPARGLEEYDKVVFAYAGGGSSTLRDDAAKIDPPLRIPVVGSAGSDMRFLLPRNFTETGTGFTLAHAGAGMACDDGVYCAGTTLIGCNLALVCVAEVETFPLQVPIAAEIANEGASPIVYLLFKSYLTSGVTAWRLRGDEGTDLDSVARLMPPPPEPPYSQGTWARLSVHPRRPETVYLRWLACENPPDELEAVYPDLRQEAIYRSTDAGDSWRRVGHRREWISGTPVTGFTRHSTGTLPWNMRDWCAPPEIEVTSTGRLFLTAAYSSVDAGTRPGRLYYGPYCSLDGGRKWSRTCPRR